MRRLAKSVLEFNARFMELDQRMKVVEERIYQQESYFDEMFKSIQDSLNQIKGSNNKNMEDKGSSKASSSYNPVMAQEIICFNFTLPKV